MKMDEVKKRAKALGINPLRMRKADLIRAIQQTEGNKPCYGAGDATCPYTDCCWREDCLG
jgi:hypothetical protein